MAGLTDEGFTADTLENIKTRMEGRLLAYDSEIDLDPASPDGVNVSIFGFEVSQLWAQLNLVYNSYNPNITSGQGLRNLGLLSGVPFGAASRSIVNVTLVGVAGTLIPRSSVITDADGNEFLTTFSVTLPGTTQAVASQAGPIPVLAGTVTTIKTVITGWTSVTQGTDGTTGGVPKTPQQYRNLRNKTVMRKSQSVTDVISSRLAELGLDQVSVINNDHPVDTLPDGTPPQTLHVVIGESLGVADEDIALAILHSKGLGCPTFSNSAFSVMVEDNQGVPHEIFFDKATEVPILVDITVTFLDDDFAGAEEDIKEAVAASINSYLSGEDVVWSRLFTDITQFGKAQIDLVAGVPQLFIGKSLPLPTLPTDVVITSYEYSSCVTSDINITVSN